MTRPPCKRQPCRMKEGHLGPCEDFVSGTDPRTAALAEAWGEVMDGRRIGTGLNAARINADTTTAEDWTAILAALPADWCGHDLMWGDSMAYRRAEATIARLREALAYIRDELGVPNSTYPMPVANAANKARAALEKGDAP